MLADYSQYTRLAIVARLEGDEERAARRVEERSGELVRCALPNVGLSVASLYAPVTITGMTWQAAAQQPDSTRRRVPLRSFSL